MNEQLLIITVKEFTQLGFNVLPYVVDVMDTNAILPILDPEVAAGKIIKGIECNQFFVKMPGIVYSLLFIKGILPARRFDLIVGKWLGIYKTRADFKGRQ